MPRILIALLLTLAALVLPSAASAATPLVEGESSAVTKSSGTEWRVAYPSGASGGAVLRVISPGTLTATVSPSTSQTLVLRDRRNGPGATATVTVDGVVRQPTTNLATIYTERQFGTITAGQHVVKIKVGNLSASDYFLDYIGGFGSSPPPPPDDDVDDDGVPDTADLCPGTPVGTPVDVNGCPIVTPPPTNEVRHTNTYVTYYGWPDNTPPGDGTYDGGHANGTGTYADPITLAVGYTAELDFPHGTIFYIPNDRKYYVVEDQCGDDPNHASKPCHTPEQGNLQIDGWAGGNAQDNGNAVQSCEADHTRLGLVIENPASNYAVVPGTIWNSSTDTCGPQFGDTVVVQ